MAQKDWNIILAAGAAALPGNHFLEKLPGVDCDFVRVTVLQLNLKNLITLSVDKK